MRVIAWLIGVVVLFCGISVYVKAPQELCAVTAVEEIPTKAVLYIGQRNWTEPWVDAYPLDSHVLMENLAGTEYRCVVVEPQDADCRELLNLLQRTQPLAQTILLGEEEFCPLAGEYRMDYMNPENMKIVRKIGIFHGRTDFGS